MNRRNRAMGFSLIELIIVMAITAVLVLFAAPKYLNYTEQARLKHITADVKTLSSKLAEHMIRNKDFSPEDGIRISIDDLISYTNDNRLYNNKGLVTKFNEEATYEILPQVYVKKETGSKLRGLFIASSGGDVYYLDDKSRSDTVAVSEPFIRLIQSEEIDKMKAIITYPHNSVSQQFKVDDGEWQNATITSGNNGDRSLIIKASAASNLISEIKVPYGSKVYARSGFKNGSIKETSTITTTPLITISYEAIESFVTTAIEYPESAAIKEYRIGAGDYVPYTGEITIEYSTVLYARAMDKSGNIIAYNSKIIESVVPGDLSNYADVIYVNSSFGRDSVGNGTKETPYKTITYAIDNISVNNTAIKIAPGNYNETLKKVPGSVDNSREYAFVRSTPNKDYALIGDRKNPPVIIINAETTTNALNHIIQTHGSAVKANHTYSLYNLIIKVNSTSKPIFSITSDIGCLYYSFVNLYNVVIDNSSNKIEYLAYYNGGVWGTKANSQTINVENSIIQSQKGCYINGDISSSGTFNVNNSIVRISSLIKFPTLTQINTIWYPLTNGVTGIHAQNPNLTLDYKIQNTEQKDLGIGVYSGMYSWFK